MLYQHQEFPPLSWSFSRMRMLNECERRYYYNYYAYHNGWLMDASENAKMIYRLKNLKPVDALVGEIFHTTVKRAVLAYHNENVNPDTFRRLINKVLKEAYRQSTKCREQWRITPKRYTMINEVYYNGDLSKDKKDMLIVKINECSKNIFESQSFNEIVQGNIKVLELDELKNFPVSGTTAYVKIDTLYRTEDGKCVLVDWKTSKNGGSEADVYQLMVYAFYVCQTYGVSIEDIEFRLEYITDKKCDKYYFSKSDIERVHRRIIIDIDKVKSYLVDSELNKPMSEQFFSKTVRKWRCKGCNFREVCEGEEFMVKGKGLKD